MAKSITEKIDKFLVGENKALERKNWMKHTCSIAKWVSNLEYNNIVTGLEEFLSDFRKPTTKICRCLKWFSN